jgi:hypothetical protein
MFKKVVLESKFGKFKKSMVRIKNNLDFYRSSKSSEYFTDYVISEDITIVLYNDYRCEFWDVKIKYKNKEVISFDGHNTLELLTEIPVENIKVIVEETLERMELHKETFDRTSQKYDKRKIEFIQLW